MATLTVSALCVRMKAIVANQDAGFALLFEIKGIADIRNRAVDVAALERRDLAGHGAHGCDVDSVWSPAMAARGLADEPIGKRARGRDAHRLALEAGDGFGAVRPHDDREQERGAGHGGDALDRRALG